MEIFQFLRHYLRLRQYAIFMEKPDSSTGRIAVVKALKRSLRGLGKHAHAGIALRLHSGTLLWYYVTTRTRRYPAGSATGPAVPVTISTGGVQSNTVAMAVQ